MCVFVGTHTAAHFYVTACVCVSVCVCLCELIRPDLAPVTECVCMCAYVLHAVLSQEPSLVRLSRLIYGPAGGACHDFLNLKSQPRPPRSCSTLAVGRSSLHHLQLCEDMCAATLSLQPFPACVFPECLECLSCPHASAIACAIFVSV